MNGQVLPRAPRWRARRGIVGTTAIVGIAVGCANGDLAGEGADDGTPRPAQTDATDASLPAPDARGPTFAVDAGSDATATDGAPADAPTDGLACGAGKTACKSQCVDTSSDPDNCGACGTACAANQHCIAGACVTPCGAGLTACGTACVNTSTDNANCGGCGKACSAGTACAQGTCTAVCNPPNAVCSGACVDPGSNVANCGACGHACQGGTAAVCSGGGCTASLHIRALIDGDSYLVIGGGAMYWYNHKYDAPGRWNGQDQPTYVNDAPWTPQWPSPGGNKNCDCSSSTTPAPPVAQRDQTVGFQVNAARSTVGVTQEPTADTSYTIMIEFNDVPDDADWYDVTLTYATE